MALFLGVYAHLKSNANHRFRECSLETDARLHLVAASPVLGRLENIDWLQSMLAVWFIALR